MPLFDKIPPPPPPGPPRPTLWDRIVYILAAVLIWAAVLHEMV